MPALAVVWPQAIQGAGQRQGPLVFDRNGCAENPQAADPDLAVETKRNLVLILQFAGQLEQIEETA